MPLPSPAKRLPIRPAPKKTELLRGFLQRAAQANGYGSPLWVCEAAGLRPSNLVDSTSLSNLAVLLGLQPDELDKHRCNVEKTTVLCGGNWISRRFLDQKRGRLCPQCILETGFSDLRWDISTWVACPEHGIALTDRCGECGKGLDWRRRRVDFCDCGAYLLGGSQRAPTAAVRLVQELDRRFNWHIEKPDWRLNDALETLSVVSIQPVNLTGRLKLTLEEKLQELADGSEIVLRWPSAFHEWQATTADKS